MLSWITKLFFVAVSFIVSLTFCIADDSSSTGENGDSDSSDLSEKLSISLPVAIGGLLLLIFTCFCCYRNRNAKPCRIVQNRCTCCS